MTSFERYKGRSFELFFVLNGLWNGEDGMIARTTTDHLMRDGWYWIQDTESDGCGPFRSDADAIRNARARIDEGATKFHRVFYYQDHIVDIPWKDDDNGGLPWWYFNCGSDFIAVLVDTALDKVEYVPAVGPAPCWEAKFSSFRDNNELYNALNEWCHKNYGCDATRAMNT